MKAQTPPPRRGRKTQAAPYTRTTANKRKRPPSSRRVRRRIKEAGPNTTIRKSGNVYYLFTRERRRIPWRLIVALFLVFLGGVGSAVSYANINDVQREIRISQQALRVQQEAVLSMDAVTIERYTHEEIARRARQLGFSEPDPSQIIYFYAPPQSHVIITDSPSATQENYFWQGIITFFNSIRDRIFG